MLSFKPKNTKKIKVSGKNSTTLDGKHREFINNFNKEEQVTIPKLKSERQLLREKLSNNSNLSIEEVMECKDRIDEINENIRFLKQSKKDYFLDQLILINIKQIVLVDLGYIFILFNSTKKKREKKINERALCKSGVYELINSAKQ